MNRSRSLAHRVRNNRAVAKVVACGSLLIAIPACQIPTYGPAEPPPPLPAEYNVASDINVSVPAGGMVKPAGGTSQPAASPAGAGKVVPAGGVTPEPIAGATLTPVPVPPAPVPVGPAGVGPACPPGTAGGPDNSGQLGVAEFYNDPLLVQLIQLGLGGNRELKSLEQEVSVAAYEVVSRRGAYLPLATVGGGGGFEKTPRATRNGAVEEQLVLPPRGRPFPDPYPTTKLGIDVFWNLDIWRQYRNARDAAFQRYLAAIERRNDFVTRLTAEIAENYYNLLALDKRIETLDQIIAVQQESLRTAEQLKGIAKATDVAVRRFEADVSRNRGEKLAIKQEIIEAENRINFRVNRFPQPVERTSASFFDLEIHALSVGVPSQLLLNRPDIRQAERELQAAGLDVKSARAKFYPNLTITAGIGYEAYNPRYLFTPAGLAANVAGNLVAPLVNKTAIQAEYGTANARQVQAVYNYQRIILDAYTEVVNRVTMAENYRKNVEVRKQQLQALEAAVDSVGKLFQLARVEYVEVLTAQRDLRDARLSLIDAKRQQLTAVVNAYQALGGGGNALPPPPLPPRARMGHVNGGPSIKP